MCFGFNQLKWDFVADNVKFLTKREYAADAIRHAIEMGVYQPGEVVSQRQLNDDLDLGITPIREAVLQLATLGLVERHSHHSIRIMDVDAEKLTQTYHVRVLLELEAVRLAYRNIKKPIVEELKAINIELKQLIKTRHLDRINSLDRQFHYVVFSNAKNEALTSTIEFIKSSFSFYAMWSRPNRLIQSVAEHSLFISKLENRDLKGCVDAHRQHLDSGLKAALDTLELQEAGV